MRTRVAFRGIGMGMLALVFGGSAALTWAAPPENKRRPATRPARPAPKVVLPASDPATEEPKPEQPTGDPNAAAAQPGAQPNQPPMPVPATDPNATAGGSVDGQPGSTPYPQPGVDIPVEQQIPADIQKQIDQMMQVQTPPAGSGATGQPEAPMTAQQRQEERRRKAQEARERAAQRGGAGQTPPANVPGGGVPAPLPGTPTPGFAPGLAGGDGAKIDIPAGDQSIPPEQRRYKFSIKDAPYSVLLDGIARQTGLAVQGDIPPDGMVSFVTDQEVSFDEMLARVRMLLFQYKPLEPYWLARERTHLQVVKVNDYIRKFPPDRVFPTVREFRAAGLPPDELVLVLYQPPCGAIGSYAPVRDWLPDYVRVTPIPDQNAMAIYALATDVEKFLWWSEKIVACSDPRKLEIVEIKFITPTEAAEKLQILMQLDPAKTGAAAGRGVVPRGVPGQIGVGLEGVPAPEVSIVPEDAQGVLIVRAMPDKIEEMRRLLPYIDVNTTAHYLPVVLEVKYAEPEALIATVQQVLSSSVGEAAPPGGVQPGQPRPVRRGTARKTPTTPGMPSGSPTVSAADVTMIPHPTISAIIVMGPDEAVTKVRDLVAQLDVETQVGPERITLQFIDADTAVQTITPILTGSGPSGGQPNIGVTPRKSQTPPQLIADPGGTSMWFTGTAKDLARVRALVKEVDVAGEAVSLHIVRLVHKKPSFVATILSQVSESGAASAAGGGAAPTPAPRQPRGRRPRGQAVAPPAGGMSSVASTTSGARITADDEQGRLYIFCTDTEWEQYKTIIAELEGEVRVPEYTLIAVRNISAETALEKLAALVPDICGPGGVSAPGAANVAPGPGVRCETTDDGLLVLGANEMQIETIRRLLPEFDRPVNVEQRTFEIRFADAGEIKQALEALINGNTPATAIPIPGSGSGRRSRSSNPATTTPAGGATGGPSPSGMTIVQVDRRLIVTASPTILQRVADYIAEFDVKSDRRQIKVYQDFRPGTDIDAIAHNLATIIGGTTSSSTGAPRTSRPGVGAGAPGVAPGAATPGPQFIPLTSSNKLIAIAEATIFPEIEDMLKVLRDTADPETIVRKYMPVRYADPNEIVEKIEPLLDMMVKRLIAQGEVVEGADETGATQIRQRAGIPVGGALARNKPYHLAADGRNRRVVVAATQKIVDVAAELVADFDTNQDKEEPVVALIEVKHVDPTELVNQIEPLLAIKVQRIGGEADLGEVVDAGSAVQPAIPRGASGLPGQRGAGSSRQPRYYIAPDERNKRIVVAAVQKIVDEAKKLVVAFDVPGGARGIEVEAIGVRYLDPVLLVDMIDPVLTMKVEQYLSQGELAPDAGAGQASAQQAQAVRNQLQRQMQRTTGGRRFHMEPDTRNKQIVIAAPRLVIEEARKLVALFDVESAPDKPVFETLTLSNADPAEMVRAVKELMGSPVRVAAPRGKAAAGAAAAQTTPTLEETIAGLFNIVVAPSGRAVVLSGPAKDVERAKSWVSQLDTISSGKTIKIYNLKHADPEVVVELIMNTVDAPDKSAAGRLPAAPPKSKESKGEDEEEDYVIQTTITRTGADLYVRADLINQTLIVASTPSKIAEIDRLLAHFESDEIKDAIETPEIPKILIPLKYADEFDARGAFNLYVDKMWVPRKTKPKASVGPGREIIVECPDESRFDEVRDIVATYVDKPKKEDTKRKVIQAPSGMSASQVAAWIQTAYPALEFQVEGMDAPVQKDFGIEVVKPQPRAATANPCVLPLSLQRGLSLTAAAVVAQSPEGDEPPADDPAPDDADAQIQELVRQRIEEARLREQMLQEQAAAMQQLLDAQQANQFAAPPAPPAGKTSSKSKESEGKEASDGASAPSNKVEYSGKKVNIVYDDATGRLILEGPESIIKDVPDWIKDLKDELSKSSTPPDIRVVRVKYIDVYTAQDILEEMFNATRSQLQNLQFSQQQQQMRMQMQLQQQQMRQQQALQRQQQQQQGRGGAQGDRDPQQQQPLAGLEMSEMPQTAVRIYPNPRDRTLILRADTIQYPAIFEMLATIDQPRPVDSVHRILQLKKLNAVDTEALLKDWLGLEEAKGRAQTQRGGGQPVPGNFGGAGALSGRAGPGSQLPRTIVSPTTSGTGVLGVDPQDIKLSSNAENNTLLVMAPPVALDYIEGLVKELEAQDIAARQWKSYLLTYADPAEMAEYLTARFNEKRAAIRDRAKPASDAPAAAASSLQTATFVSYPRLKMLSVQATDEQLAEIDTLVKELDVEAEAEDFRTLTLIHADAAGVAATLTDMFGSGGSARSASAAPRRDGESRVDSVTRGGIRFIGEESGRIVFYTAPKHLEPRIADVVRQLEDQASVNKLRTIQLQHAKASTVADAIEQAMSGARRSTRGSSRGATPPGGGSTSGSGGGAPPGTFSITASDSTKRLFVIADESTFQRIQDLATALDVEPKMDVEFKVFPLQHADAETIYDTLSALMTEYVKRLPPQTPIEAFSVEPNAATNSLIVLGGPIVFGFVEDALRRIDTPQAAPKQDIRTIQLLYSDAEEVQAAVQSYLRKPGTGGAPASGGRGGAQSAELVGDTRVSVLTQTNSIVISGNKDKLDQLETVIRDLDKAGEKGSVPRIIALRYANVGQLLPMLQDMFAGKTGASKKGPPPVIGANEVLNALVVRGTPTDIAAIESVVAGMDNEQAKAAEPVKIIQIQPGVNLEELAAIVETSVNEGQVATAGSNKNVPRIVVTAEPRSNLLVVAGSPMLFPQAEAMARKIEEMGPAGGMTTTVFKPTNVPVEDIQRLIDQLTNPSTGGDRARRGGGGGSSSRPSRGGSRPRESTPAPAPRP